MPKTNKNTLYVILDKKRLNKNFFNTEKNIFTLNKFILNKFERKNINHFFPDPLFVSSKSKSFLLKTSRAKNSLIEKLKKIESLNKIKDFDELLDPYLEIKISRFFYIQDIIPDFKYYILVKQNKLTNYSKKIDLLLAIDYLYSDNKTKKLSYIDRFSEIKSNPFNNLLLNFQSFLLKFLLLNIKKEVYLFSDRGVYFIDYLKSKFISEGKLVLYFCPSNSYLRIIKLIIEQFLKLFFWKNYKEIGFFLLPFSKSYNTKAFKNINSNLLDKKYTSYLLKQVNLNLSITNDFTLYLKKIFDSGKIKKSFFHSVRFPDLFSLSRVLSQKDNNVNLISHGSHTTQKNDELNSLASESIGIGLAYTKEKNINLLSQSNFCDDYLDSLNYKYSKINFIINKKRSKLNKKIYSKKRDRRTQILYVGTVKALGARRYYYESSPEFFGSIFEIYKKISKYKKIFELIVRIRDVPNEINDEILNNAFGDLNDLITLRNETSLDYEIDNCDCMISYSSTVLEEGIQNNKPVMCFGLPEYNHFINYENIKIKEKQKIDFKKNNLQIIENCLQKNFIYKNFPYRNLDYIY